MSDKYSFSVNVPAEIARRLTEPPKIKSKVMYVVDEWIDVSKQTPPGWAKEWHWGNGEGRHRVRLQDGREIYTWWKDNQWSVERLKPHLKVAYWKRPVLIA
jgi:hypothetical protein